jgi:hypothetical protein
MKSNPQSNPQRRPIGWLLSGGLTIASLSSLATVLMLSYGQQSASAESSIPPGVSLTSWFDNGKGGQHVLRIAEGAAPPVGVRLIGTVATDTDCDPDEQGLNHCHNKIDLSNGRSIEVIHNHAMHRYACLEPGQKLTLTRLNADWIVAYEGNPPQAN